MDCISCGLLFETKNSRTLYCSDRCKKAAKVKQQKTVRSAVKIKEHVTPAAGKSIAEIICELEEYNAKNKARLTYGQFVAMREGR